MRVQYGGHCQQFGEWTLPDPQAAAGADVLGVAVIFHGGFWRDRYDLSLGRPLAADLAQRGWAAWNVEYRRSGSGGGWPQTFEDAGAAVDVLADLPGGVPLDTVVTIGHSAGGLLAVWAALRRQPRVPVNAAISQAGVLDINGAVRDGLGGGAAQQFFGAALPEALDPVACPATVPVFCVHAPDDDDVPIAQSRAYVAAAAAAKRPARLVEVGGGHYGHLDPRGPAWSRTLAILDDVATDGTHCPVRQD